MTRGIDTFAWVVFAIIVFPVLALLVVVKVASNRIIGRPALKQMFKSWRRAWPKRRKHG